MAQSYFAAGLDASESGTRAHGRAPLLKGGTALLLTTARNEQSDPSRRFDEKHSKIVYNKWLMLYFGAEQ